MPVLDVRALGDLLQERVCLSHNAKGCFSCRQPATGDLQFPGQSGDLRLIRGGPADLLTGLLPGQKAGVAELPPLGDLRGVDGLLPQIRSATTIAGGAGLLVGGQVMQFLGGGERPTTSGTTLTRPGVDTASSWTINVAVTTNLRISPRVKRTCYEPLASTHPGTQGLAKVARSSFGNRQPVIATKRMRPPEAATGHRVSVRPAEIGQLIPRCAGCRGSGGSLDSPMGPNTGSTGGSSVASGWRWPHGPRGNFTIASDLLLMVAVQPNDFG